MREPAVADRFYPGTKEALHLALTELLPTTTTAKKERALAVISPHAGYIYSGALAAKTISSVIVPKTVIILGPKHQTQGANIALSIDTWRMPMGEIPVNQEIASLILDHSQYIKVDELAHQYEHSLEVQLPFLHMQQRDLTIVPLLLAHLSYQICENIGQSLAYAIRQSNEDILIVASSDMSHYESRQVAEEKDEMALKPIEELKPADLYNTVFANGISMCGVIPVVIALLAVKELGAKTARLIGYTDSGYISGDTAQVVGYAGLSIS